MATSNQHSIISFPRSGQHMTERMLGEFHKVENIPYSYCEFYTNFPRLGWCGCKSTPCKNNSKFQKNHDFDLSLEIKSNQKYLFLYRMDKIEQLEAWWRHHKKKNKKRRKSQGYSGMVKFCRRHSSYYDNLVKKYVGNKSSNVLCVDYNYFLNNPPDTFHKIINFFGLGYSLDHIDKFVMNRKEKISKTNTINMSLLRRLKKDLRGIL